MKSLSSLFSSFPPFHFRRSAAFGVIIIAALFSFELFNFSTTEFALSDLLGDLTFLSLRWATILAVAFCAIDFAGIARLFTPDDQNASPFHAVWYLFGAWLLAATMNAMLTWWGISIAILNHQSLGTAVVPRTILLRFVPIFVAILIWLIRVLIIGTFSAAGDQLFSASPSVRTTARPARRTQRSSTTSAANLVKNRKAPVAASSFRSVPKPSRSKTPASPPPEPSYHPLSMNAPSDGNSFYQM